MYLLRSSRGLALALAIGVVSIASACGNSNHPSGFETGDASMNGDASSSGGTGDDGNVIFPGDDSGNGFGNTDGASSGGSSGGVIATALVFKPAQTTLILDGVNSQMTTFQLWATVNGTSSVVIPTSLEFDRPDLGTVTSGSTITLTAFGTHGGVGHLQGIYGGLSASAEVDMIVVQKNLGTVPQTVANTIDSASGGSGADAGPVPAPSDAALTSLLYPYDKTVFPLGLTSPLIMWNAPTGGMHANDVYRLHLQEKSFTYDLYSTVPSPAQLRVPQADWESLTGSNAGPGDPLHVVLSRYDAGTQMAAVSVVNSWTIAPAALQGAIYYWTASYTGGTIGYITRLPAGNGAVPQKLNSGRCMGCHAVSADGTTLVASVNDYATAPAVAPYVLSWMGTRPTRAWASFDVTQATERLIYQSNEYGADLALTPDGKYTVWGAPTPAAGSRVLSLSSTAPTAPPGLIVNSGLDALQSTLGTDTLQMPAFSPDGTKLAVVRNNPNLAPPTNMFPNGDNVLPYGPLSINYLTFHETTQTFDATITPIVQASDPALLQKGLAYPSFTPDTKYIAFHAGTHSTGCQGSLGPGGAFCDDTTVDDGDLYVAPVAGGGAIRLATTDDPPNPADHHASVEPTFDPKAAGGYSWVVFTSMRVWGNQPWPAGVSSTTTLVNGRRRLWVAAIDQTIGTTDPSHPAFYIEGQDDAPNMRGFWANGPCIATPAAGSDAGASASCTQDYQCCSGFCQNGMCVDVSKIACNAVSTACTTSGDCCNAASNYVMCINNVCTVAPAK
jgi:hypothetical protein